MPKPLDLSGKIFGRLIVLERTKVAGANNAMWLCRCDCGNETVAAAANLGRTKFSCGCFKSESARASLRVNRLARDDLHGLSHTDEWKTWSKIRSGCYNPNIERYPYYGGKGIRVCDRWLNSFENFYSDMGRRPSKRHSIDRIDVDKDYEPSNCRWATPKEQARNTTRNAYVEIDGRNLCVQEWCEVLQVPKWKAYEMIRNRGLKRNLPPECPDIESAIRELHRRATATA